MDARLAIVGCGAATENLHFPAVSALLDATRIHLVDPDPRRLTIFKHARAGPHLHTRIEDLPDDVTHAILAAPNHLHVPIALELIERGIRVLVEKPVAHEVGDLDRLATALSSRPRAQVHVGHFRRFFPGVEQARAILASGVLGRLNSFTIEEGQPFAWPSATPYRLDARRAGGGVLLDIGTHVLDLAGFVLGGRVALGAYRDNSWGGPETECEADVRVETGRDVLPGRIDLSWSRRLPCVLHIHAERGDLTLPTAHAGPPSVRFSPGTLELAPVASMPSGYVHYIRAQAEAFLRLPGGPADARLAGVDEASRLVREILGAYARRERLVEPGCLA